MALDRNLEMVFESEAPYASRCITWKIHHCSCFLPTRDKTQKSCKVSTDTNEVWQFDLTTTSAGLRCSVFFFSAKKSKTNVYCTVSLIHDDIKYFTTKKKFKTDKREKYEIWWLNRKKILEFMKTKGLEEEDALTFHITIEVWNKHSLEDNHSKTKPQQTLNTSVTKLWTNNSLTDVTLKVGNRKLTAHKVILAAMSPVFEAMFKEGTKEHQDNHVNIEDIESDVFELFLRYLYSGQVDKLEETYLDIFPVADKYDVQPLREICIQHMAENMSVDNAVDVLALAECHSVEQIKSLALQFIRKRFTDVSTTDAWTALIRNYPNLVNELFLQWTRK